MTGVVAGEGKAIRQRADEMMRQADELDRQADSYRGASFYGTPPGTHERRLATSLRLGAAALIRAMRFL